MKYLFHQSSVKNNNFLYFGFLEAFSTDPVKNKDTANEAEKKENVVLGVSHKEIETLAVSELKSVKNLPLSLKKRIFTELKKECGLNDGIIDPEDTLAGFDKNKAENIPVLDDKREAVLNENGTPRTEATTIARDLVIDETEFKAYLSDFDGRVGKVLTEINQEPLYKEEADAFAEKISDDALLDVTKEDFVMNDDFDSAKGKVRELLLYDIKNGVYTQGEKLTCSHLSNNDLLDSVKNNLSSYIALVEFPVEGANKPTIDAVINAVVLSLQAGEKIDWDSNSKFDESEDGGIEIDIDNSSGVGGVDQVVLTKKQLEGLGISADDIVETLSENWRLIQKRAEAMSRICPQSTEKMLADEKGCPTEPEDQKKLLALVAERIGSFKDIDWEDLNHEVFEHATDGGLTVDRYAWHGMKADGHILTYGELSAWGLKAEGVHKFLNKKILNIQALSKKDRKATAPGVRQEIKYEDVKYNDEFAGKDTGKELKEEKAQEEASAQAEIAAAKEKEAAQESARNTENELFLSGVTAEDYAALGITLNGKETLDEKITTIQEKLIEKGQTVSASGTIDKWAGRRTIAALENVREEYAQNTKEQKSKSAETKDEVAKSKKETTTSSQEKSPTNEVTFTDENGDNCSFLLDELGDPEDFSYLETNEYVKDKNLILRDSKNDNIVYIKHSSSEGYNNPPKNFNVKFVKRGGKWTAKSGKWNTDDTGTILDLENQRRPLASEKEDALVDAQEKMFAEQPHLGSHKG